MAGMQIATSALDMNLAECSPVLFVFVLRSVPTLLESGLLG